MAELRNKATLDTKPFNSGLKGMEGRVSSFAGKLQGAYRAAGATAAVGAMVRMGKAVLNTADEIDNLSKQLQIGIESTQSLKVMFEEAGMSLSSMNTVVATAKNAQAEALNGNKQYAESFERLGISMNNLKGMNMEQVLESVSRAITNGGNSSEVTASAIDILGSRSVKLEAVLRSLGTEGFDDLNKRMIETQQIMSKDVVVAADKMEEGITRALRRTGKGIVEDASKRLLGLTAARNELLGLLIDGERGYGAAYIQSITGMESSKLVDPEKRKAAREREAEAMKQAALELQNQVDAQKEIYRISQLTNEERRKEIQNELDKVNAGLESVTNAEKELELLKEKNRLTKLISSIPEEKEESAQSPDSPVSLGQFARIGANMNASGAVVSPHEQRKLNMQQQILKTAEAQERLLKEIADKRNGSTF